MNDSHPTFATTNHALENFFFCHDIHFMEQKKGEDLHTIWIYEDTPYLREILAEFKEVDARRKLRLAGLRQTYR